LELWQYGLLGLVGFLSGWVNVIAGGGSLLTIPVMLFMGIPGAAANGTNRLAILVQNIAAVTAFFRGGFSSFRLSISLSLAAIPGALIGAWFGTGIDGVWFDRLVAVVMILVMVLMMKPTAKSSASAGDLTPTRLFWGHVLMFFAGIWGGLIQIGIGFILMPILSQVLRLDLVRVNMHKVFIVLAYTVVALAVFAAKVEIYWIAGTCLAIGSALGGWLGVHHNIRRGENLIRWVLNAVLVVFVIKLLFF